MIKARIETEIKIRDLRVSYKYMSPLNTIFYQTMLWDNLRTAAFTPRVNVILIYLIFIFNNINVSKICRYQFVCTKCEA